MTSPDDRLPPPFPPPLPSSGLPPAIPVAMPAVPVDPRPVSVRILSIIGMIFGSLALLTPLTSAMQLFAPVSTGVSIYTPGRPTTTYTTTAPVAAFNPVAELYARPMLPWTIGLQAVAFVLGAWLLWAAIATWRLRDRGRRAMLAYAIVAIVFAIGAGVLNATYVMPTLFAGMAAPRGQLPAGLVRGFAIAVGVGGAITGTIFPTFILVCFRRPNVVAAFARNDASDAA